MLEKETRKPFPDIFGTQEKPLNIYNLELLHMTFRTETPTVPAAGTLPAPKCAPRWPSRCSGARS